MKRPLSAVPLSLLFLLFAVESRAADPVYIDELMESSAATLQRQFPSLRKEGCYRLADGRFLMLSVNTKDQKPWRVAFASAEPCRGPSAGPDVEVRHRSGVQLGDSSPVVVEKLGRPDASAEPEAALRRLGDIEYFYICRISEGCARHTSVFIRDGLVSAISEWYSE